MSGVKGRSGRGTNRDEAKRLLIIEKAWDLVREKLNSTDSNRYEVAKDIALKDQTQTLKTEFSGDVVVMGTVKIDDKPAEPKVGD
jgi:hypothetical protein